MEDLGAKQRSLDLPRLIDEVKQSELLIGLFTAIWTRVVVESAFDVGWLPVISRAVFTAAIDPAAWECLNPVLMARERVEAKERADEYKQPGPGHGTRSGLSRAETGYSQMRLLSAAASSSVP